MQPLCLPLKRFLSHISGTMSILMRRELRMCSWLVVRLVAGFHLFVIFWGGSEFGLKKVIDFFFECVCECILYSHISSNTCNRVCFITDGEGQVLDYDN